MKQAMSVIKKAHLFADDIERAERGLAHHYALQGEKLINPRTERGSDGWPCVIWDVVPA